MSETSSALRPADRPMADERERLPLAALLALAMTGLTAILTETLPAGLLPLLARSFGVSPALAGQLVTSYAAGSLLAAIPMTAAAQRWRRKPTLLAAIGGFLAFNTMTAVSTRYDVALAARFCAGVAAGLAWGMLAGYARRMVSAPLQGRALAIAMVGTPVALSLGVPAGTFLGAWLGWRAAFLVLSASTLGLIGWVVAAVPDFAGQARTARQSVRTVFATPGVRPVLAVVFAWMTAHNILYTFVAPLAARAGLVSRVDLLLFGFGLAALVGIAVVGLTVDRWLRLLVIASLVLFGAVTVVLGVAGTSPAILAGLVLAWGLSFGGAATLLQTAIGDEAGEGVDLANAMVTTVWNGAIAGGGLIGGLLLQLFGAGAFAWACLVCIVAALATAIAARRHGFRPGRRAHA